MSAAAILALVAYCVAVYLLGSAPFGYLLGRLAGADIRRQGSRNIGATNCWRVCGWRFGLPAFAMDVAKGLAATLVAERLLLAAPPYEGLPGPARYGLLVAAGAAAIAGHVFPIYLGFRGGKAVATSLGVFLGIRALWPVALGAFVLWAIAFAATRYVSVASTAAALGFLAAALTLDPVRWLWDARSPWTERWPLTAFVVLLVAVVLARHRENYRRLLAGTENRFGRARPPRNGGAAP